MVKFNIVEGYDYFDEIPYEDIKHEYLDPNNTIDSIMKKYRLNNRRWRQIRQRFKKEGVLRKKIPSNAKKNIRPPKPVKTYNLAKIQEEYENWDIPMEHIRKNHDLTLQEWNNIMKRFKDEGVCMRPKRHRPGAKNYYYHKAFGKWIVKKMINGKLHVYGVYTTERRAKTRVKELKSKGWKE